MNSRKGVYHSTCEFQKFRVIGKIFCLYGNKKRVLNKKKYSQVCDG
jgi:hypothetical protein